MEVPKLSSPDTTMLELSKALKQLTDLKWAQLATQEMILSRLHLVDECRREAVNSVEVTKNFNAGLGKEDGESLRRLLDLYGDIIIEVMLLANLHELTLFDLMEGLEAKLEHLKEVADARCGVEET